MVRTQTMVQLSEELVGLLDAEAKRLSTSRSALIREAVEAYLKNSREAALSRLIVDGYRRVPQGQLDDWGDADNLIEHSTAEVLQRLDVEEAEHGMPSW